MIHLSHSRAFVSILLIAVLQLAFLPRVGACGRGALEGGACCCAEGPAPDAAVDTCCGSADDAAPRSCCGGGDSDRAPADPEPGRPDVPGKRMCGCTAPASSMAARYGQDDHQDQRSDRDDGGEAQALTARRVATFEPDLRARFVVRVHPAATPRPPTGPPLYLRKQVFLI